MPALGCLAASRFTSASAAQELFVGCRVGPILLDQIVQQRRCLLVEARVGELLAEMVLRTLSMMPSTIACSESLPFSFMCLKA